jgi:hypothetical protein
VKSTLSKTFLATFLLLLAASACRTVEPTRLFPSPTPQSSATAAPTGTPESTVTPLPVPSPTASATNGVALTLPSRTQSVPTCEDLSKLILTAEERQRIAPLCGLVSAGGQLTLSSTPTATFTAVPVLAVPVPTSRPTPIPAPAVLTFVVSNQIVTSLYRDPSGAIYYGVAKDANGIGFPSLTDHAVWKLPVGGAPIQLTPYVYRLIGGVVVHNGTIYFNEGGQAGDGKPGVGNLRRMPDDNAQHDAEIVLHYPTLSVIWGHVNHALAVYPVNGQEALLMAVGSILDSNYDPDPRFAGIQPPWYEPFPTGRILYATFTWLDQTHNYKVTQGVAGQFDEYARGFRNPWAMTAGVIDGKSHVFAVDNDPALTPAKKDSKVVADGDEVNDVYQAKDYGHPFAYGGNEPAFGDVPPITNFPKGSVPSGVAVAAGKLFVALHDGGMIVKVDLQHGTWAPVLTNIQPFNLFGYANLLYVADFGGIRVIDASGL